MKIFEPHAEDKAEFVQATQVELEVVQNLKINGVSKYYEFVTDGVWEKRNGRNA